MATLPTPKQITTTVHSQYCPAVSLDAQNLRADITAFDRDENTEMVPGTVRKTGWFNMMATTTTPDLPPEMHELFFQTMAGMEALTIQYAKQQGVVDADAVV